MHEPIGPSERLSLTLNYLASGSSQCSISSSYRISPSVVSRTIRETCHVLWSCLSHYIKAPSSTEEWKEISRFFEEKWNFPHALGAMDGKHVIMQCPARGVLTISITKRHTALSYLQSVIVNTNSCWLTLGMQVGKVMGVSMQTVTLVLP